MDAMISSAIAQQQQQVAMQTQMSVLKKSMDVQEQVNQGLVNLIESAAAPLQTPGKAVGLGNNFDAFA